MGPKISLLSIFLMVPYIAFASATWPNEPAGSELQVDCPFANLSDCKISDNYGGAALVTDATAPISPSSVVKSTIAAGANSGGVQLRYGTPRQFKEFYVGLMWRTNPQFEGRTVANKLFFVRGPQVNGFFGMWNPPGSRTMVFSFGHNSSNLDNSHTCRGDLGLICDPNAGPSVVTIGQWTKIEVYMKASTTMTSRDGIVRWWVNGVMGGNYTNFNYSTSINEWVWSETWDGYVNPVPNVEWAHYIDHLHISAPNAPAIPVVKIAPASLPSALVGAPYLATLTATGGLAPYTWFVVAGGTLPAGLKLNQLTGVISGTATTAGTSNFTIKATDKNVPAVMANQAYSITTTGTNGINGSTQRNAQALALKLTRSHGRMVFGVNLPQSSRFALDIFDSQGRTIWTRAAEGAGSVDIPWETDRGVRPGVYVLQLRQGNQRTSRTFFVE